MHRRHTGLSFDSGIAFPMGEKEPGIVGFDLAPCSEQCSVLRCRSRLVSLCCVFAPTGRSGFLHWGFSNALVHCITRFLFRGHVLDAVAAVAGGCNNTVHVRQRESHPFTFAPRGPQGFQRGAPHHPCLNICFCQFPSCPSRLHTPKFE